MNLVSIDKLSKTMGDKTLFEDISFGLDSGQKTALIGVNGCGKSTLLKIIAGKEKADKGGNIALNKECRINYLSQLPPEYNPPDDTILDHIMRGDSDLVRLIRRYEQLCASPLDNEKYQAELDATMEEMNKLDAWQYEYEVKSILGELGGINDVTSSSKPFGRHAEKSNPRSGTHRRRESADL